MLLLNLIDLDPPNEIAVLGGIIILIYVIVTRVRTRKQKIERNTEVKEEDRIYSDKDILGMDKPSSAEPNEVTSMDKLLKWKTVLLIFLMILGLYLVYANRPNVKDRGFSPKGSFEQNDDLD